MLPGPRDAPALFCLCALFAVAIAISLRTGRTLTGRWSVVRRDAQPGVFWTTVGLLGVCLCVSLVIALMAVAPWPPGAKEWSAPHANPRTSLSDP